MHGAGGAFTKDRAGTTRITTPATAVNSALLGRCHETPRQGRPTRPSRPPDDATRSCYSIICLACQVLRGRRSNRVPRWPHRRLQWVAGQSRVRDVATTPPTLGPCLCCRRRQIFADRPAAPCRRERRPSPDLFARSRFRRSRGLATRKFRSVSATCPSCMACGGLEMRHRGQVSPRVRSFGGRHQLRILPEHGPGPIARNARSRYWTGAYSTAAVPLGVEFPGPRLLRGGVRPRGAEMTSPQIARLGEHLQRLRLNTARERLEALLQEGASANELSHADFLDRLLSEVVNVKTAKYGTRRAGTGRSRLRACRAVRNGRRGPRAPSGMAPSTLGSAGEAADSASSLRQR